MPPSLNTSDEWIFSHTGIRYRHIAADDVTAADIGTQSAENTIRQSGIPKDDIDFLILTTSTPDHPGSVPPTASIVQNQLQLKNAGAMDLGVACSGFVYAVELARNFILAGSARNVLIISTEVYSKVVDWDDRNTCVLFGDGAASCLVSATDVVVGIGDGIFRSDGSGGSALYCETGNDGHLVMNGRKVYNFAVHSISLLIYALLELNKVQLADLRWVVPHQANQRMIESVCRREGIDRRLFVNSIAEYGNTASASIPIAMSELAEKGLLQKGDILLLVGFGQVSLMAELSCAGILTLFCNICQERRQRLIHMVDIGTQRSGLAEKVQNPLDWLGL